MRSHNRVAAALAVMGEGAMVFAVVRSNGDERSLVRTLASLVRGVVEGPLAGVVIAANAADSAANSAAQASGAGLIVAEDWAGALAQATIRSRSDHLLLIESGVVLGESFWPCLAETLALAPDGPLVTRPEPPSLWDRLMFLLFVRIRLDQAIIVRPGELSGNPWQGGLRVRPRLMHASSFRPRA